MFKQIFLIIVSFFTIISAKEISNYNLLDNKGNTYALHDLLDAGHYIAIFFTSNT